MVAAAAAAAADGSGDGGDGCCLSLNVGDEFDVAAPDLRNQSTGVMSLSGVLLCVSPPLVSSNLTAEMVAAPLPATLTTNPKPSGLVTPGE